MTKVEGLTTKENGLASVCAPLTWNQRRECETIDASANIRNKNRSLGNVRVGFQADMPATYLFFFN